MSIAKNLLQWYGDLESFEEMVEDKCIHIDQFYTNNVYGKELTLEVYDFKDGSSLVHDYLPTQEGWKAYDKY